MNAFIATCTRLAENRFVTGNFELEKILNRNNRSLKSSGNFIIAADMGMVWDTISPVRSSMTLGKDYIIQARPGRQRNVTSAQGNETFLRVAEVMSMIFTGNNSGILDNFDVYYSGSLGSLGNQSSLDNWELGLSPLDRTISSFMKQIILKGGTDIRYIQIHEQNGDITNYFLSNHKYPGELSADEKAFFIIP
jgi:hypothetical protein